MHLIVSVFLGLGKSDPQVALLCCQAPHKLKNLRWRSLMETSYIAINLLTA